MLQSFEETKLYVSPSYTIDRSFGTASNTSSPAESETTTAATTEKVADICNSVKLKRKQDASVTPENPTKSNVDTGEIGVKDLIANVVEKISNSNATHWFQHCSTAEAESKSLFEPIQQALNHIDFNLKRNSDFINELTKLLDTSRTIKQEAHLKKVSKLLDENKPAHLSVPASPVLPKKEERKKSFSLLSLGSKSPKV